MEFSPSTRNRNLEHLKADVVDVLVIGGGITGAGVAREAALRGLSVGLLEKDDFASGTSSRSARMIHGGLRYLEHYQFGLVLSACAERHNLFKMAPRLVRPTSFTYPVYRNSKNSLVKLRLGMVLYDSLALFRNFQTHRILKAKEIALREPALRQEDLEGAAYYYDCLDDDARLTLATILAASRLGALIANHVKVQSLLKIGGKIAGVKAVNTIDGDEIIVRAAITVNATGVWTDKIRQMDDAQADTMIRANRGTHVVFPRGKLPINGAVAFSSPDGKRAMYAVPWKHTVIVGTTDEDHAGDLDEVFASQHEVSSVLDSANHAFPKADLILEDIISTYAGLRPLIGEEGKTAYQVSRDHHIFESESGLVSIAGGKLTTFRKMAEDLLNHIDGKLGDERPRTSKRNLHSEKAPLIDLDFDPSREITCLRESHPSLDENSLSHLVECYGDGAKTILRYTEDDPELAKNIVDGLPHILAEVPYAVQYEMALTLNDFLVRRTHIIHEDKSQGLLCAPVVASLMAKYLGWSKVEIEGQLSAFRKEVDLTRRHSEALSDR